MWLHCASYLPKSWSGDEEVKSASLGFIDWSWPSEDWAVNYGFMILNGCWSSSWLKWYIIIIMVCYHQQNQVLDQDSLRLGFWPLVNPNQLHWANQGIIRRWGLWCIWGSSHGCMELIEARVSPLSHFIRRLGLRLINALPNSSIRWKSQLWSTVHDLMDLEVKMSWRHFIHVGISVKWHCKAWKWRKSSQDKNCQK